MVQIVRVGTHAKGCVCERDPPWRLGRTSPLTQRRTAKNRQPVPHNFWRLASSLRFFRLAMLRKFSKGPPHPPLQAQRVKRGFYESAKTGQTMYSPNWRATSSAYTLVRNCLCNSSSPFATILSPNLPKIIFQLYTFQTPPSFGHWCQFFDLSGWLPAEVFNVL